ncbi:copper chaperone PCu(A)C [Hydrogenovibrio halophilus]|uniref:copper chaperone PCu(A)C n=1 Tax=Hydrogenovibrio halophilus TaxID=373391 RepID=UPI0003659C01|nr:copper chaperone PCu(A)C [Hydrogenovibrio halophilus]
MQTHPLKQLALSATLVLSSVITLPAMASDADQITVQDPYVREVPPGAMATGSFMQFHNQSDQAISLVKAESDTANRVELHTHTHDNGVMKMREIEQIEIPANGTTELKPGGLHIMLIDLPRILQAGEDVTLTLQFADGSEKTITAPVQSLRGGQSGQQGNMDHSMH